uniref:Uncharacterized protein n=1 Tax=Rhizophora mucronata TaxID=61149 RepID=A0A2P2NZL6_RHIMU
MSALANEHYHIISSYSMLSHQFYSELVHQHSHGPSL